MKHLRVAGEFTAWAIMGYLLVLAATGIAIYATRAQ